MTGTTASLTEAEKRSATGDFINRPLVALILLALVALSAAWQVPVSIDLSQPGVVMNGFYDLEGRNSPRPYRWTDGGAQVWLAGLGRQPYHLVLTLSSSRPPDVALPSVTVLDGGRVLGTFNAPRPIRDFPFELATDLQSFSGDLDIRINSETFAPPGDLRTLGLSLYSLRLESLSDPHVVLPAPLPLIWGILVISLLYLSLRKRSESSGRWTVSSRLAWAVALLVLLILCAGIAASRLLVVAALPWAIFLSTTFYALSLSASRSVRRTDS